MYLAQIGAGPGAWRHHYLSCHTSAPAPQQEVVFYWQPDPHKRGKANARGGECFLSCGKCDGVIFRRGLDKAGRRERDH